MRPYLSLKTLLRTPFRTIMTFLLVAAASFALFSRFTDYVVTNREMNQAASHYQGVAALDNGVQDTSDFSRYSNLPATLNVIVFDSYQLLYDFQPPTGLTIEQIDAFSSLPGITSAEIRYMTGGTMKDYKRIKSNYSPGYNWGYDYTARFVIEGTYAGNAISPLTYTDLSLKFTDIKQHAGNIAAEGGMVSILIGANDDLSLVMDGGQYIVPVVFYTDDGDKIRTGTHTNGSNSVFVLDKNPYDQNFADNLKEGSRYLLIGRYIPNTFNMEQYTAIVEELRRQLSSNEELKNFEVSEFAVMSFDELIMNDDGLRPLSEDEYILRLGDQDTIEYCPSFWELDGKPENYLETGEFSRVKEIIDITNNDLHTFDIVYTSNMRSIPRFNERSMVISEGRALMPEDTDSCVVSQYFFETYNLNIGDKLTIELGDRLFGQNAGIGAVSYIPERQWKPVITTELEIVGIYTDIDSPYERNSSHYWGYSPNTVFVPMSLLPVDPPADHEIKPGEYSVAVNTKDIDAFLEKATPLAEKLGIKLRFSDGGWSKVKDSVNTSGSMRLLTTILYICAAGLALLLAVYLYIGRKKKDYAIMRALGTPRAKSQNALALPLSALAVLAMPTGGIIGLVYTSKTITSALEHLANTVTGEYVPNASIPIWAIALCLVCELAFLTLLSALFLRKLGKTSPLTLLQGGEAIRAAGISPYAQLNTDLNVAASVPAETIAKRNIPEGSEKSAPNGKSAPRKYTALSHVTRYVLRHMSRAGWKTAISLTLAVLLTGAIGLLAVTGLSYKELFNTVNVRGTAAGFSSSAISELSESELTESFYYYSNFSASLNKNDSPTPLTLTNDLERYLQGAFPDGECTLKYAEGFSDTVFFSVESPLHGDGALCILGSSVAEISGVKPGDSITLMNWAAFDALTTLYYHSEEYRDLLKSGWELEDATDEDIQERLERSFQEELTQASTIYKVAGIVESANEDINGSIFTPSGKAAEAIHGLGGQPFPIEYSEFILMDNEKTSELTDFLYGLKSNSSHNSWEATYHIDTTELDNVRRVRDLMILLFPVAVTVAVLIGLFAPGLIIVQSAKEAAILRVLGTTKKRARCMLALEQISLSIMGLTLAAGGLVLYNTELFVRSAETLAVCGALYLLGCVYAAFAASVSVTKRKVLELLQTKE